jgi:hypothetical protein
MTILNKSWFPCRLESCKVGMCYLSPFTAMLNGVPVRPQNNPLLNKVSDSHWQNLLGINFLQFPGEHMHFILEDYHCRQKKCRIKCSSIWSTLNIILETSRGKMFIFLLKKVCQRWNMKCLSTNLPWDCLRCYILWPLLQCLMYSYFQCSSFGRWCSWGE